MHISLLALVFIVVAAFVSGFLLRGKSFKRESFDPTNQEVIEAAWSSLGHLIDDELRTLRFGGVVVTAKSLRGLLPLCRYLDKAKLRFDPHHISASLESRMMALIGALTATGSRDQPKGTVKSAK